MQVGPHELAARAVLELDRRVAVRVHQLEQRVLAGGEVESLALAAGARHRGPHVAHAEAVGHACAPGRLDLGAQRLEAGAGLARGHDVAQPQRARIHPRLARPGGQVRGEGEGAEDGVDAELRDQLEQAPRLARPHGHHRGAARLEGHVVGDAARVERVVEAVGDHVVRPHAGDPERLAAHGAVRLVVAPREAHGHRLARGSGRHVHADEALERRAQMGAERRVSPLALAKLVLRREGQVAHVGRGAHVLAHAAEALAVEVARRLEVRELVLQRTHSRGGRSPAAALSRVAWTVRP